MWPWGALAFLAGALIWPLFSTQPGPVVWGVILLAVLWMRHRMPAMVWVGLGLVWSLWHVQIALDVRWPVDRSGERHWVEGRVVGLPTSTGDHMRFDFKPTSDEYPTLIRVSWYRSREYLIPGQVWRLPLELSPPSGRLGFFGFDYARYLFSNGVGALARVRVTSMGPGPVLLEPPQDQWFHRLRQRLSETLQAQTTDLDVAALKRALLVGDRSGLSDTVRLVLQDTGTAHLLAISGLHVGMVAGFGIWVLGPVIWVFSAWVTRAVNRRSLAWIIGWLLALGYAGLAGFSVPTQRALVMLSVAAMATLSRRKTAPFDALLVAACVVVIIDPLVSSSTGAWLSFVAVACLVLAFAGSTGQTGKLQGVRALFAAQVVLFLGLMPISIGVFGQWTPMALIANWVAIPWVSVVVLPSLLLDGLLSLTPWSVELVSRIGTGSLQVLLDFLFWLDSHSVVIEMPAMQSKWMSLSAGLGVLLMLAPWGWGIKLLGLALWLPALMTMTSEQSPEALNLTLFDVGSGRSVWIEVDDYRLLWDAGPGDGEGSSWVDELVLQESDQVRSRGERVVINDLVISHPHREYSGGLLGLLNVAWVERFHSSRPWETPLPAVGREGRCRRGDAWAVGAWRFEMIHPTPPLSVLDDNGSCVLWIHGPTASIVLMGSLDAVGEAHLMDQYPHLSADLVIAARAGHDQTLSTPWLRHLNPVWTLISVSNDDPYHRPAPELLRRLDQANVTVLRTDQCGAIEFVFKPTDSSPDIQVATEVRSALWRPFDVCG